MIRVASIYHWYYPVKILVVWDACDTTGIAGTTARPKLPTQVIFSKAHVRRDMDSAVQSCNSTRLER